MITYQLDYNLINCGVRKSFVRALIHQSLETGAICFHENFHLACALDDRNDFWKSLGLHSSSNGLFPLAAELFDGLQGVDFGRITANTGPLVDLKDLFARGDVPERAGNLDEEYRALGGNHLIAAF